MKFYRIDSLDRQTNFFFLARISLNSFVIIAGMNRAQLVDLC